jgi:hypothetical protein
VRLSRMVRRSYFNNLAIRDRRVYRIHVILPADSFDREWEYGIYHMAKRMREY